MTEAPNTCEVRWQHFWDEVIEQQVKDGTLGFHGELDNPRGDWVLFTAGQMLVDARAENEAGVQEALRRGDARRDDSGERERERRIAARLDLVLYTSGAAAERLVETVRDINRVVARSASLDHVLIGGPARWGGDSVPQPIEDPGTVPGRDRTLGSDIRVVVLDSGIAKVPFEVDAGTGNEEVPDEDSDGRRDAPAGHGTHVAGLVASVAAGAKIAPRRILTGVAGLASDLQVAGALLDNADADIINCSFSGPVLDDGVPLAVERALARLSPSTVVVACAGNHGSARPQWPAASKGVIAVAAVRRGAEAGRFDQPDFTNFGGWVDCCAPGVDVPSTFLRDIDGFEGFATWTGTSMACPQVAGAIAATATRHGVDVKTAAYRLVHDPARPRLQGLGAIVDPDDLPQP